MYVSLKSLIVPTSILPISTYLYMFNLPICTYHLELCPNVTVMCVLFICSICVVFIPPSKSHFLSIAISSGRCCKTGFFCGNRDLPKIKVLDKRFFWYHSLFRNGKNNAISSKTITLKLYIAFKMVNSWCFSCMRKSWYFVLKHRFTTLTTTGWISRTSRARNVYKLVFMTLDVIVVVVDGQKKTFVLTLFPTFKD